MINLDQVYEYSQLLKIECIKKEVEEFIKGFTIKDIKLQKGTVECLFENNNGETIYLGISLKKNVLIFLKKKDNLIEYVKIDNNLLLVHEIIEKRPNGIIYSIIKKMFDISNKFKNAYVLVDLVEQRFVFSRETLELFLNNCDFDNTKCQYIL